MVIGIHINLTHTGLTSAPVTLADVNAASEVDKNRPGSMYISPGQTKTMIFTSVVALSYEKGHIRGYMNLGYLTATFSFSSEILDAMGFQVQIDALDARVTALEAGQLQVLQSGVPVLFPTTKLNFVTGASIVDAGGGQADVTVTGGGSDESFAATCLAGATVNQIVYLSGAPGPEVLVAHAIHPASTYPAVGFIAVKSAPTVCLVQTDGELGGFVGLLPGAVYFLSATVPGAITAIAPNLGGQVVQKIGQAKDATTLIINIDDDFVEL